MFVIGALNPQVGNDRRNQLLQRLLQQYMGQSGSVGIAPTNLMRQTPVFGTAVHVAAANMAPGGRPEFTGQNFIPASVFGALGPGGVSRAQTNVQSPGAGIPVPGLPRGATIPTSPTGPRIPFGVPGTPAVPTSAPGGAPIGTSNPQAGATGAVVGSAVGGGPPGTTSGGGVVPYNPVLNPGTAGIIGATAGAGGTAPTATSSAGAIGVLGGVAPTVSNGLVPLGNGVYYNPTSGQVMGTPMGGLGGGAFHIGGRI
jgi:hypothetical protein